MNVMDLVQKSDSQSTVILKTKILGIREDLDKVKEKWQNSRKDIENEFAKKQNVREEIDSMKEKVIMMNNQCKELLQKMNQKSDKLMGVTKYADECERARRALEHRKNVDQDRMGVLEEMLKDTRVLLLESQRKSEEVCKKITVVNEENEKANGVFKFHDDKVNEMRGHLKELTIKLKGFQKSLEQFDSREEKYDQTIQQLEARLKNARLYNERSDAQIHKLQHNVQYLYNEVNQVKKSK